MIAIIGAGITGLTLAHELARREIDFIVFDAAHEPGGVMRTIRVDGRLLELGPQRTRLTPIVESLITELGLEDEVLTAPPDLPLLVYRKGKLRRVPFSVGAALSTDLISWPGKLRVLAEPFTRGPDPEESVGGFLTRKFGREAYLAMLGPLYGGLYASDPMGMMMRYSLSRALAEFGIEWSILAALLRRARARRKVKGEGGRVPPLPLHNGMNTLPRALQDSYQHTVHLGNPFLRVREVDGRPILEPPAGQVEASPIVLTTPAEATAHLLAEVAPGAAPLARLRYNPLVVVHLRADCPIEGMGYQVALDEGLETRGVSFNHSLFGREGVYTVYLGGAKNPDLVRLADLQLGGIAAAEFELVTGATAEVLNVSRVGMPAWDRSWVALDQVELPPWAHLASNYESRAGVPGRLARAQQLAERLTRRAREPLRAP